MSTGTSEIRNLVAIGHRGCGKTSLLEAFLYAAGATTRQGSVDAGNSILDFEPEERARKLTISPALCTYTQQKTKVNLIDTPGFAEFFGEVMHCLWVADTAMVVVDAASGVEVHTHKVYESAKHVGLPIMVVVNKMRGEHAEYADAIMSVSGMVTGAEVVPVQVPIGRNGGFEGVVDLISKRAFTGAGRDGHWGDIPGDIADEVEEAYEALIDAVAANDEGLMEKYFENGTLSSTDLSCGLAKGVISGEIVPLLFTDAVAGVGIGAALDFIANVCPAPNARPAWVGHQAADANIEVLTECNETAPFSAVVFKTMSDPYVGRISLLRIVSGKAVADGIVTHSKSGNRERLSGLATVMGAEFTGVNELFAGDLGCVTKLENALTGDTLSEGKTGIIHAAPELPKTMHSAAVVAASHADEDKLAQGLSRLSEEDIGFTFGRETRTGEMLMHGMGALHLDVIVEKLGRKFETVVTLSEPKVPYRETVQGSVRVQGRHKKQTGGRGQFGDVWLRVSAKGRDEGFEFVNEIKGGRVPTQYIPAVEKGVIAALQKGKLTGWPVVDIEVVLDDGSYHDVDSSDQAFQMAGQIGIRNALEQIRCVLLEPIMSVEVTVPEELMGDVMSDMSGRRGRVQGSEPSSGGLTVVRAIVPLAEMSRYAADLRSISQGRATYTMEPAGYEEVPSHLTDQIVAALQAEQDEE